MSDICKCGLDLFGGYCGPYFVQAAFEVASGMGTVGVTMGITPSLTVGSALLMVALMFLGRVGILSFSIAFLTRKQAEHKISYPATDVMIG